jgi:hypothetical protein
MRSVNCAVRLIDVGMEAVEERVAGLESFLKEGSSAAKNRNSGNRLSMSQPSALLLQ